MQVASSCGTLYSLPAQAAVTLTVSASVDVLAACSQQRTADSSESGSTCMQCPHIEPETDYIIAIVADNGPPSRVWALSQVVLLNVSTADTTPPSFELQPAVTNIGTDSITMRFALSEAGQVDYALAYASLQAPFYSSYLLSFAQADFTAQQVVDLAAGEAQDSASRPDGIVAAGSVQARANQSVSLKIEAPCTTEACAFPENVNSSLIAPATDYILYLVARDIAGNVHDGSATGTF